MCDTVSVAIVQDDDGISVQVTSGSGTDTGLRLEHAAQVAMGTFQQALQAASINQLALEAASDA